MTEGVASEHLCDCSSRWPDADAFEVRATSSGLVCKYCGGRHPGAMRVPSGVLCTCKEGAPGISDGQTHGPDCAIVVRAMADRKTERRR